MAKKKFQKLKSLKTQVTFLLNKLSQNFDFSTCPSQNVLKCDASGKKGKLLCCKCIFDQTKTNLANIQPENLQNVQKRCFWPKMQVAKG